MKNIALYFLLSFVAVTMTFGQSGRIVGKVADAESMRPLESANIVVEGTAMGTASGKDGSFDFPRVPPGTQRIAFSFIGYSTRRFLVSVQAESTVTLNVALQPTVLPGQTVVVRATRGHERETPATFSTLEAEELARRYNTQDIPQLLSELPSTTFYSENGNGIGYNYLNIRGFDQRRISVMVNGIPQNDPEDHNVYWLDFPDLASNLQDVQVQRGAGSAFYGPAAIGGSVNLVTSSFATTPSVELYAGAGSFNTRKYSASMGSGLVDGRYAFQARLSRIKSDGYRKNAWTDFSSYFLSAVRYDEIMTTQINFYGGPIADHLAYYGISKQSAYSSDEQLRRANPIARPEEIENFSQPHYELLHEWNMNDRLTLSNTVFLVTGEGFFDYDGSWAPYSYYRITPQNGFAVSGNPDTLYIPNALIRAWVGNVQYGWLPRATIQHHNGELTIGAEARVHRSLHWGALRWGESLPAGVTPDYHYYEYRGGKDMMSLYAHELYLLREDLTLMLDLQYAYNKYRLHDEKYLGTSFSVPYHFLNPRLGINYNIDNRFNVYAQVSHTSREPRMTNLYDAAEASSPGVIPQFEVKSGTYDVTRPLVKPESLTDLEGGAGYRSDHLRATVNLFLMEFRNEIIKSGQLDRFGQPITGNADRTRHLGVEATLALRPLEGLELGGNVSLSRNRLVKYTIYDTGTPQSLDGNVIAGFPEFLANARATYTREGFSATLSLQHVGEFATDNFQKKSRPDPDRTVNAYTVAYGWLGYRAGVTGGSSVELRLQANNLFDAVFASHGEGADFFPAARRAFFASLLITF